MAADFTILALCAGGGGLERAIRIVVPQARVVCMVEREAFCMATLATTMETDGVGPVALWTDLATFDGHPWRGLIDMLAAGIPCQPHSVAGKHLGAADERNLWPACERVIREVEPPFVFLENVAGAVAFFGEHVIGGLEAMGYAVEAGLFEAAEVGASHRRQRLFILAYRKVNGCRMPGIARDLEDSAEAQGQRGHSLTPTATSSKPDVADAPRPCGCRSPRTPRRRSGGTERTDEAVADTESADGRRDGQERQEEGRAAVGRTGAGLGDTECPRRAQAGARTGQPAAPEPEARSGSLADAGGSQHPQRQGERQDDGEERPAAPGSGLPLFPPGPADLEAWAEVLELDPMLRPAQSEAALWQDALLAARQELAAIPPTDPRRVRLLRKTTQSHFRRMAHGLEPRVERLRMLGNACCPLQAAYAFVTLLARIKQGESR